MCGIAGLIDPAGAPIAQAVLSSMLRALAPRGRDGEGTWYAPGVGLGHRRLAAIDYRGGSAGREAGHRARWPIYPNPGPTPWGLERGHPRAAQQGVYRTGRVVVPAVRKSRAWDGLQIARRESARMKTTPAGLASRQVASPADALPSRSSSKSTRNQTSPQPLSATGIRRGVVAPGWAGRFMAKVAVSAGAHPNWSRVGRWPRSSGTISSSTGQA